MTMYAITVQARNVYTQYVRLLTNYAYSYAVFTVVHTVGVIHVFMYYLSFKAYLRCVNVHPVHDINVTIRHQCNKN